MLLLLYQLCSPPLQTQAVALCADELHDRKEHDQMHLVHTTKSSKLVKSLPVKFGQKMPKGQFNLIGFMPHCFISSSAAGIKE